MRLLFSDRAMLDSARHDKHLSRPENHIAVPHLNGHSPLQDEEEIVRIIVLVPGERTSFGPHRSGQLDHGDAPFGHRLSITAPITYLI